MFRCFKLDIQNTDFFDQSQEYIQKCKAQGELIKEKLNNQLICNDLCQ